MNSPETLEQELAKARKILAAHPEIDRIEMILPDINARLRGKWLPVSKLESYYTQGVRLAGSVFALDMWGAEVHGTGMISENGDPDSLCFPAVNGLQVCDWTDPPVARLLVNMFDLDGKPFFADPAHIVKNLSDRLAVLGLRAVVALEMEFHLFDKDEDIRQQTSTTHSDVYSLQELDRYRQLLSDIEHSCRLQGIPSDTMITEAGANQFEINLVHVADAGLACEHAVMLKHIIKSVADRHGVIASFMAKPFADDAGNGMHVNISLEDEDFENVFCDNSPTGSPTLKSAVAGLLETLRESTLLYAPHANSYRRFQPESHAPTAICWGVDNRNMAVRLPANAGKSMRIEHRVAGADANPWLVVASVLAGMLHGLEQKLTPPPPETGIPDRSVLQSVPRHWDDAIELFDQSAILRNYLGNEFCDLYVHCKQQEISTINSRISDIEYDRYLLQS